MAQPSHQRTDLKTPVRNRYFYGKLLDVFHFEMEQTYFNSKRWLLNRHVTGPGVVCGLDVELTPDRKCIVVLPGVAIDYCGREIIVTEPSRSVMLPELAALPACNTDDRTISHIIRPILNATGTIARRSTPMWCSVTTNARAIQSQPWLVIAKRLPCVPLALCANSTQSRCGQATPRNGSAISLTSSPDGGSTTARSSSM